jgi:hypothetical protein
MGGTMWGASCNVLITTYGGAVGNGSTDATTAINNTLSYAHTNGCTVEIPAGTFAYSNELVDNGVVVYGLGSTSILKATNTNDESFELTGSGGSLSNVVLLGTGTSRLTTYQAAMIWINGASNYTINNVLINGGSCVGIYDAGGSNGLEENNTVENTLADSITNTNGANNITVQNNLVINSGDDGISNNSYTTDPNTVNHITVNQNAIMRNAFARGLEVSGGSNIAFTNNYVDNESETADIILASETTSYQTQAVNAVTVTGNTFVNGGPGQGTVFLWPNGSSNVIENVTVNNNRWYTNGWQTFTGVQVEGTGTVSNTIIENSSAYGYGSGPSFYSSSATGPVSITQSGNTTAPASSYPGPIAPPTGGTEPIPSLPAGDYTYPQTLTLVETTSGDVIKYCTTVSPSCTPTTAYSSPITINGAETICSVGVNNSSSSGTAVNSAQECAAYTGSGGGTPTVATPTISPAPGTYSTAQTVTLSDSTSSSSIYYTTNGTTPTTASTLYATPFSVGVSETVEAIATASGNDNSTVAFAVYIIGVPPNTAATPIFSPDSGSSFSGTQPITLTESTPSSTIHYYTSSPAIQIVTSVGPSFKDSSGYVWTITSGGQMAINGNVIPVTSNVTELVYVNGNVWQLNTSGNWYEVASVTSPTGPSVGYGSSTTTSPIPAYSTYSSPISLSASSSITAYATASGFTQSATATAAYTPAPRTLVSAYLRPRSGATSMTKGSTMQLIAYATYSDDTTGTLPDASGNVVTWWNTTNHKVAVISGQGRATALSQGSINMEAMVGTLRVSPWQVIVGAATPAVKAAPVPAIQASTAANPGEDAVQARQNVLTALTPEPGPTAPGGPLPDTFLGPFWRIVAPAGGSASISNSHLFLGVPGGGNHDPLLPSNQAVRVVQTIGNENFDVAVKIDSPLFATDGNTSQGLMVLSGSEDFISFALTTDGTKIGLSARKVTGGAATTVLDETDFSQYQNPMYLRVTKAGSAYVAFYSVDGANWTQAASFTDTTIFTSIGPFASNYDRTPANATPVVMSVDWFDVRQ